MQQHNDAGPILFRTKLLVIWCYITRLLRSWICRYFRINRRYPRPHCPCTRVIPLSQSGEPNNKLVTAIDAYTEFSPALTTMKMT